MLSTEDRVRLWKDNTAPPIDRPFLYNAFVVLKIESISIGGEVRWDLSLEQYVFQPAKTTSDTTYELYEVTVSSNDYLTLRQVIRDKLGVHVTRGIHDTQCPPRTLDEQVPASFTVTSI